MLRMLDTNICIYLIKKKLPKIIDRLIELDPSHVCISSITLGELEYGVEKSVQFEKNREVLEAFLLPLEISPFDDMAAVDYGKQRAKLEKKGSPIGSLDLMIGAHALSLGAILVTNNTKEFNRIEGLKIENWV